MGADQFSKSDFLTLLCSRVRSTFYLSVCPYGLVRDIVKWPGSYSWADPLPDQWRRRANRERVVASKKDKLKLGFFIRPTGHHIGSWRHPEAQADAGVNMRYYSGLEADCPAER